MVKNISRSTTLAVAGLLLVSSVALASISPSQVQTPTDLHQTVTLPYGKG